MSNDKGFIKFIRDSREFETIIIRRPTAFALLALIAMRAKRTVVHPYPELKMGEALIGDHEAYGATPRSYRTDKKYLEMFHLATFQGTNKGTIAKLTNSCVFDINFEIERQAERQAERQDKDKQATTNNNVKNEKKELIRENLEDLPDSTVLEEKPQITFKAGLPADLRKKLFDAYSSPRRNNG